MISEDFQSYNKPRTLSAGWLISDNYILIATACMDDTDDKLVFYDVDDEKVFLYDQDLEEKIGNVFELKEIIKNLRPDI